MKIGGSELATRLVVAFILIGLAFAALFLGGSVFWLVVVAAGLLMMGEWAGLTGAGPAERRLSQYALSVPLAAMSPLAAGPGFLALGLLAGACVFVGATTRRPRLAWGVLYVGLPVLALVLLRERENGLLITFWAMALVWACDSGAYFAGRAIGGPKLAPAISPNKTWAGFLGGVAAAGLFAWALVLLFGLPVLLALATPLLAVLAQAGDLYESHLKRVAGVKDSGNLLPGHGGVMDRLDGLVAVAPVAALLVLVAE
ncbi:phosphatidate cytidylyltransferase [Sphingomonas canadensis]|uniref:Phosphatidate cytidylyltransferase n=1 Tax=Sphingomonas canadensis TaxID=1219257 RepID=A0ABW3HDC0_9SPHN|nr:phosphatidate cytidylyltransferase [Sphingomonas canadensis]MCW3838005.1 phosphatidate cytidylyltransferase [Sphingomonas canadensis]